MNKEKKTKEVSVESFNLPSGKLEHPPLTEKEKAHNTGAASVAASYWPAKDRDCKFEDEAGARGFCKNCGRSFHNHTVKLPAFGIRKIKWGGINKP